MIKCIFNDFNLSHFHPSILKALVLSQMPKYLLPYILKAKQWKRGIRFGLIYKNIYFYTIQL